ncbi:hypothetical protein [Helicobacter ailurogastricus]|uniref:Uncharacterized protein n=1 Tax=Helicobacter ailurogastricus TaxID=1578720 RepID=A0A0K2Y3M1_9HELI|nr:hypothetical protein [Helicobacter ailurogastricus]CRF52917.1 hypothetical protein HAL07_13820 [Helicobacter ailurogastricus]BDQ28382.1 hypothetical protein ASB7_02190 [Helicobacter ailurogastricus]GLH58379.1 hypothetical protein NHP214376_11700 [Helicobacter ailurogastricus]GLH59507.1 hypothetical protein NHP214377_07750 [Helicobacter ailurogastricus]GMB89884.1 hypothetical protein NHP190002_05630 [Helicobacter ailurogastricus]
MPQYNPHMLNIVPIPKDKAHLYAVGGRVKEGKLVPMSLQGAKECKKAQVDGLFERTALDLHNENVG